MEKLLLIGERLSSDQQMQQVMEREDYALYRSLTASEGLDTFRREQPAVVILERELDDADGVELLKELCREAPACGVILVTSTAEMDAAIEVLRAGAVDYLRRPLDDGTLRLALGRARERRQQSAKVEPPSILVLEDHEPTRIRLVRVLEKEGYRVNSAADGDAGTAFVQERRVDLILADVRMPKKDGISVLRDAKRLRPDIEVIVVTGYGDEEVVIEALREGAINFLRKPIEIEQMLLAIEKAIEFQNTRRSLSYRNRDMALMRELVVRLTRRLELVVDTPEHLGPEATRFLGQLVDALPLQVVVTNADRQVLFASSYEGDESGRSALPFGAELLAKFGITEVDAGRLMTAMERLIAAAPGTIETLDTSNQNFIVMTPVTMRRSGVTERLIAVALSGDGSPRRP